MIFAIFLLVCCALAGFGLTFGDIGAGFVIALLVAVAAGVVWLAGKKRNPMNYLLPFLLCFTACATRPPVRPQPSPCVVTQVAYEENLGDIDRLDGYIRDAKDSIFAMSEERNGLKKQTPKLRAAMDKCMDEAGGMP